MLKKAFGILKQNSLGVLLILLGSLAWSLTMVKSGLMYDYGMGFWGPNGHDGIWHIALIKSLARGSWQMPVFAGEALKNYHLGYDLLLALTSKLSGISPIFLYFQLFPPIFAVLIGVLTYKFVVLWKNSKSAALWATFFVYFGGSLGWVISLVRGQGLGGESMFWAQQSISTLVNPPFALSLVFMLLGLILTLRKKFFWACLLFGILIQIKAYAGLLVLGGLLLSGVFQYFKQKKQEILRVFAGAFSISLILFTPLVKSSSGLVVFQPFWFLETMMALPDRVGWERFYSAMTNWRLGGFWIKAAAGYFVAFAIFWFGNLGTRLIKEILVISWIKDVKKITFLEIFFASVIVAGVVFPLLFLQKGTPWNTIQFIYYSLFFSGILAGVALGEWQERQRGIKVFAGAFLVIVLTLPTTISSLGHYLPSRPPARISNEELGALEFLSRQPTGIVLAYPFDRQKALEAEAFPPRPLYLYESTAYVAALSGQPTYLEDEVNLAITDYPWEERRSKVDEFLKNSDIGPARKFLQDNNISYIYWIRGQKAKLEDGQLEIEKIFENQEVGIFRVKKS